MLHPLFYDLFRVRQSIAGVLQLISRTLDCLFRGRELLFRLEQQLFQCRRLVVHEMEFERKVRLGRAKSSRSEGGNEKWQSYQ